MIGHEISHGFDDQGSRFDAEGNLKMWWTPEDEERFDERTACVVKQFDAYEVQPGLFINGKLTLGENIGDFAGLTVAYDAYQRSLEGKLRPADIDGFTPEQRFFLGWAQVWAAKERRNPNASRSRATRTRFPAGALTARCRICPSSPRPSAARPASPWSARTPARSGENHAHTRQLKEGPVRWGLLFISTARDAFAFHQARSRTSEVTGDRRSRWSARKTSRGVRGRGPMVRSR